ncbi:hypothetical protein MXB_5598 [Myxobolus squamalis]|nr:hypothetical protein MXB_5598 [Myxobolus squamalis]
MNEIEAKIVNQTEITAEEANEEQFVGKSATPESDVFNFLRSLKLENYYEVFAENGAEKLGQLIYVDDTTIDHLCVAAEMKLVHAGVFRRAIKECRASARVNISIDQSDKIQTVPKVEQSALPYPYNTHSNQYHHSDLQYGVLDRRRFLYTTEHAPIYPHMNMNSLQIGSSVPQSHTENYNYYSKSFSFNNPNDPTHFSRQNYTVTTDEPHRQEIDRYAVAPPNLNTQTSTKSNSLRDSPLHTLLDGSYYVIIVDRNVKFPPTVKQITHLDRMDQDRRDIVRKGSQIYGRDDTKRKHNELTPLEVFMNEIAYEICLRDFTYMISRQKLLGLVREIVKDNQIQLSGHHSFNSYASNGKGKQERIKPGINFVEQTPESVTVTASDSNKPISDYDVILYHKIHREWPLGTTKEHKKYLGRRSSNFEAIGNILYYSKDHKKRRWVDNPDEIFDVFTKHHIDSDTNCHYSRESTIDRLSQHYYFRNMTHIITELFLKCIPCKDRYKVLTDDVIYAKRPGKKLAANEDVQISVAYDHETMSDMPALGALESSTKRKLPGLSENLDQVPQAKKARKSTPRKLVFEGTDNVEKDYDSPKNTAPSVNEDALLDSGMEIPAQLNFPENEETLNSKNISLKEPIEENIVESAHTLT